MQAPPFYPQPSSLPSSLSRNPLALLALAAALLPGCDITIKDGDVSFQEARGRATQEFNRTYPLAPDGRVEVVNINGDIEVAPGPAGKVEVAATMSARAMSDERAKAVLAESKIDEE